MSGGEPSDRAPTLLLRRPMSRGPSRRSPAKWVALGGLLMLVVFFVLAGAALVAIRFGGRVDDRAIVRVVAGGASGSGFFVDTKKDDSALVVTAFHLLESGEPALLERPAATYVEAFPDPELVAFDADADLAILRVKGLPRARAPSLELTTEVAEDGMVVSAGFPSGASRVGLLKKEGKLLDAAPVLLISYDLEAGLSGGPTTDEEGRVVGVNMLGGNRAVASEAVEALLGRIRPYVPPTSRDVEALLERIQDRHLLLPAGDRAKVAEHEVVAMSEVPLLRAMAVELRRLARDQEEHDLGNGAKASGRALLDVLLARLPGASLETYEAPSTQELLRRCEDRAEGIRRFLGGLEGDTESPSMDCIRPATRPLAWDLAAATLAWSGTPREYHVESLDEVAPEARVFRAGVRVSGLPDEVPMYVAFEAGVLRLDVFDENGRLHLLERERSVTGRDFEGKWIARRERRPDPSIKGAEVESEDRLTISVDGTGRVRMTHELRMTRSTTDKRARFACNHEPTVVTAGIETLTGKLEHGVITGSSASLALSRDGCTRCGLCQDRNKLFVAKLRGGHLVLYSRGGVAKPKPLELTRPPPPP